MGGYLQEENGARSSSRLNMILAGLALIGIFCYVGIVGKEMPGGTEWIVALALGPYGFNKISGAIKAGKS